MNITQEKIDDLNSIIRIELNPEDYNPGVDKHLREYGRKISMPGFRQGKVPAGMVKKMYGKSLLLDEINKITSDSLLNYIREHQLNILGNPLPKPENDFAFDIENPGDIRLAFEIGLSPDINPEISNKHKFNLYLVKIDDEYIQNIIDDYRKRLGTQAEVETAGVDDILHGEFFELDESGNILEGGIHSHADVQATLLKNKDDFSVFTGLVKGSEVTLDMKNIFRDELVVASLLRKKKEEITDLNSQFKFKIEDIKQIVPAEINQEFFDNLYGQDKVHSEEDLRKKISDDTLLRYKKDAEIRFFNEAVEYLIKNTGFDLPDDFMKRWLKSSNEGKVDPSDIETNYEKYAKGIRWQLIEGKILRDKEISFNDEDVLNRLTDNFLQYMGMGMGNGTDNEEMRNRAREIASRMLNNEKEVNKIHDQLVNEALTQLFLQSFDVHTVELPMEKWVEQMNAPLE